MEYNFREILKKWHCALGAAMFAAVAAGVYRDIMEAMKYMGSDVEVEYKPDTRRARVYETLYQKYLKIAEIVK